MADKPYHELIDKEWKIVEKTLPTEKKTEHPQIKARAAFNGILWILKSGAPWRLLPEKYGKWNSVYKKFRIKETSKLADYKWSTSIKGRRNF